MKKVAIVTGGSRGIGLGIAKELAAEGFVISIMDLRPAAPEELGLGTEGEDFILLQGDISKPEDHKRLVKETVDAFGRIDVLVNNAGVAPPVRNDMLELSLEDWDFVLNINTRGTMFLTQEVAKYMVTQEEIEGRKGIIVNISSMSARVSSPDRAAYCVSKAGVSMLTTLYADRLAKDNILVYELRPGVIDTDMTDAAQEKYDNLFAEGFAPINRWGTPQDLGKAAAALCTGAFAYTTGQVIDIDGGLHIESL